jgi:hypothetical protein
MASGRLARVASAAIRRLSVIAVHSAGEKSNTSTLPGFTASTNNDQYSTVKPALVKRACAIGPRRNKTNSSAAARCLVASVMATG